MKWMLSRLWAVTKSYWALLLLGAGIVVLIIYVGQGWALVLFSAALVLATVALAVGTDALSRANITLAQHQVRTETRNGLEAAKAFIEIDPVAFVDVVKGPSVGHPSFNAIDELALYAIVLHDKDIVRDVQQLAYQMDLVKTKNAGITPDAAKEALSKLQHRVVNEMVVLRRDLRDWTKE